MALIKLSHSLVLLGILHLILILFCLVTGAPSVGNHRAPTASLEDPTLIAPPHDAAQSSDSGPPKSRGPHSSYHLEQRIEDEDSLQSPVVKGEEIAFGKDEAKVDEVTIRRLAEKSASTDDDTGSSIIHSETMAEELIEQISKEQGVLEVKDINPSRVVEDNLAARDSGEMAGAIPLPRTAPPLKDVILARQKLGLELPELLNAHIEQTIDNGQQSPEVSDLQETISRPEFSVSNVTTITHESMPPSSAADEDGFKNDPNMPSEDHVKESFQNDILMSEKPIAVDKVQFVAKTKEYLYENKRQISSGHEVKQLLPDEKVLLATVEELPDKADDYVVGFKSSNEIVGDTKDALETKQQKEFMASANVGGDNSKYENLAEGTTTETSLLERLEDFEDVSRNRLSCRWLLLAVVLACLVLLSFLSAPREALTLASSGAAVKKASEGRRLGSDPPRDGDYPHDGDPREGQDQHQNNEAQRKPDSSDKEQDLNKPQDVFEAANDLIPHDLLIQSQVDKVQSANREAALVYLRKIKHFHEASGMPSEEQILSKQRENLLNELHGYHLHSSLGMQDLDHLVPELGGKPVRNLIVTTWRSGSTFLGDVLQSHPATYYHYEPLLDFEIVQARWGELASKAVGNLHNLLHCNYTGMDHYLEYGQSHPWLLSHNNRLWWVCSVFRDFCSRPDFLSRYCKLFPFQSVKVVRLRMNLTEPLLQDDSLAVRVVLLVRDPRGTMQSRRHRDWCTGNDDCENPQRLCEDLVSDYHAALDLQEKFPGRVRVIRYEDLSFNAYNLTRELFDFFRLSYVGPVEQFLQSHTKKTKNDVYSTFRDSKVAPVHWKVDLTFEEVDAIQAKCQRAMTLYGYRHASSKEDLLNLDTIGPFNFPVT